MKKYFFLSFFLLFLLALSFPQNALATTVTLNPTDDASTSTVDPADNTGSVVWLPVGRVKTGNRWDTYKSYFKFNLSQIPKNSIINSAKFRIFQDEEIYPGDSASFQIYRSIADWSENTLKLGNEPAGVPTGISSLINRTREYKEIDVNLLLVQGWVKGDYPNYGFNLEVELKPAPGWNSLFYSKEADKKPELVINYILPIVLPPIAPKIPAFIDIVPPVISGVTALEKSIFSATIIWTTNELSTSYVDYGDTVNYTSNKGQADSTKTHEVILSGLIPFKTYHFRVISKDNVGNEAKSADNKFTWIPTLPGSTSSNDANISTDTIPNNDADIPESTVVTPNTDPSSGMDTGGPETGSQPDASASSTPVPESSSTANSIDEKNKTIALSSTALLSIILIAIILVIVFYSIKRAKKHAPVVNAPGNPVEPIKNNNTPLILAVTMLFIILFIVVVALAYFFGQQSNLVVPTAPTVPSLSQSPTPGVIDVEKPQTNAVCPSSDEAINKAFMSNSYTLLTPCLADLSTLYYSISGDKKTLGTDDMVKEITGLAKNAQYWMTEQDNYTIKKMKEYRPAAYYESFIVISGNTKDAFAFDLDKDKKIWSVVYINDYVATAQPVNR